MMKPVVYGVGASILLLGIYVTALTLVSGWRFAQNQFFDFWYFIIALAIGFGVQIGLYVYLRTRIHGIHGSGKMLGVTGATSTAAMISCCTHYLANLLPILGVAGVVTFVAQYQVELFWVGILFNILGIIYMAKRINTFSREKLT